MLFKKLRAVKGNKWLNITWVHSEAHAKLKLV